MSTDINNELDIERAKTKFLFYADFYKQLIKAKGFTLTDDISIKKQHSLTMGELVSDATKKSGFFNESYIKSAFIDGLLHDVGRFPQFLLSGTLSDAKSKEFTGFDNHGEFGAHVLEKNNYALLRYLIGDVRKYYQIVIEVVRNHTVTKNLKYKKQINDLINIFPNYDLSEILISSDEEIINMLIALKLLMVVEEDSLELIYNVRDGKWKPKISSQKKDFTTVEVLDKFFNQEEINIPEMRKEGKYTCNGGFLFRYNLIPLRINYKSSVQTLIDDDTVSKVFEAQYGRVLDENEKLVEDDSLKDPTMIFARDYTDYLLRTLLVCCGDKKIITPEIKQAAKELTQKEFGPRYQELREKQKTKIIQ